MKKTVDARGMSCPLPVIETKKALKEVGQGQLEVLVDNEVSLQNLEKMARQMGLDYELLDRDVDYAILLSVGAPVQKKAQPEKRGVVVVLASDQMGSGDPELGKVLMKSFIYALTEGEQLPDKILLYNGGVKLAVQGAETAADLKKLAERGVEVLNCGTCLNFYNLTDQLAVGSITNMYEIVQSQMEAELIIRP